MQEDLNVEIAGRSPKGKATDEHGGSSSRGWEKIVET